MAAWMQRTVAAAACAAAAILAGCGGGSGGGRTTAAPGAYDGPEAAAVGAFVLSAPRAEQNAGRTGRIALEWSAAEGAVRYAVQVAPDATAAFADTGAAVSATTALLDPAPSWALDWPTARVRVRACDAADACTDSNVQPLAEALAASRPVLLNAADTPAADRGALGVAISDDGRTVASLRPTDLGMLGNPPENFLPSYVDVYERTTSLNWVRAARLPTPDYTAPTSAMALSGDGRTLAVNLVSSYGGYSPENVPGRIAIYRRQDQGGGSAWRLQDVVTPPPGLGVFTGLGYGLALSDDGRRLAATASGGEPAPQPATLVFVRGADERWRYQASVPSSGPFSATNRIAMSGDGLLLAIVERAGSATVPVAPGRTAPLEYYVVRLYRCRGNTWQPAGELRSDAYPYTDGATFDDFARADLAVSDDGSTVVVGAPRQQAASPGGGAVFVFGASAQRPDVWTLRTKLQVAGGATRDLLGLNLSLSGNGRVLAASRCSRIVAAEGVARAYPTSPPPPNEPRCGLGNPGSAEGDSHAAHVFRRGPAGAWAEASVVVPPLPPLPYADPPAVEFDVLQPVLDRDGRTLAIGVHRDTLNSDGDPGVAGLTVY